MCYKFYVNELKQKKNISKQINNTANIKVCKLINMLAPKSYQGRTIEKTV